MTLRTKGNAAPAPNPWALSLGIVFGGGILLGGMLLIVAAVKASNYQGLGGSGGVYGLLTWGFPLASLSVAALSFLVATRAITRRIRARRSVRGLEVEVREPED